MVWFFFSLRHAAPTWETVIVLSSSLLSALALQDLRDHCGPTVPLPPSSRVSGTEGVS